MTTNITAGSFAQELDHLKNHVRYPANKAQLVATCNEMADVPAADKEWFAKSLPEGNYRGADQVLTALLTKV